MNFMTTSLEFFNDPRTYDLASGQYDADVQFYSDLIEKYGEPVLELMCGTGRLTIPYAEKGIDITGIDLSEEMLGSGREKIKQKGLEVEMIKADCRDFTLNRKFKFIFIPFSSIQLLLGRDDIEACFKCVRNHLEDDGRFVFSVFNPDLTILNRDPEEESRFRQFDDPDGRGKVTISEKTSYNRASQILTARWFFTFADNGEKVEKILNVRILFPQELDILINHFGFEIEDKFGDFDFSKFESSSPHQLFVCKLRR